MLSYENCTLCPRACGVNRTAGQTGFCRMPGRLVAARAAAHYWEEPVISGSYGSGAVFFSGCTLGCRFCQNDEISRQGCGKEISSAHLREIFERLIDDGVQNINLVTPTHFLPSILPALTPKLPVPVVYNCGGYETVETLRQLEGLVDIYLPDMKYSDHTLAARLSAAPDYAEGLRLNGITIVRMIDNMLAYDLDWRRLEPLWQPLGDRVQPAVDNALRMGEHWNAHIVPHRSMEHDLLGFSLFSAWIASTCADTRIETIARQKLVQNCTEID